MGQRLMEQREGQFMDAWSKDLVEKSRHCIASIQSFASLALSTQGDHSFY